MAVGDIGVGFGAGTGDVGVTAADIAESNIGTVDEGQGFVSPGISNTSFPGGFLMGKPLAPAQELAMIQKGLLSFSPLGSFATLANFALGGLFGRDDITVDEPNPEGQLGGPADTIFDQIARGDTPTPATQAAFSPTIPLSSLNAAPGDGGDRLGLIVQQATPQERKTIFDLLAEVGAAQQPLTGNLLEGLQF